MVSHGYAKGLAGISTNKLENARSLTMIIHDRMHPVVPMAPEVVVALKRSPRKHIQHRHVRVAHFAGRRVALHTIANFRRWRGSDKHSESDDKNEAYGCAIATESCITENSDS